MSIHPFLALLAAAGLSLFLVAARRLAREKGVRWAHTATGGVWAVAAMVLLPMLYKDVEALTTIPSRVDSRSNSVNVANTTEGIEAVVIAEELRVHEQDLRHLRFPRLMAATPDIIRSGASTPGTLYILPKQFNVPWDNRFSSDAYAAFLQGLDKEGIVSSFGAFDVAARGSLTVNPRMILYLPSRHSDSPSTALRQFVPANTLYDNQDWQVALTPGEPVRLPAFRIQPGTYKLRFEWAYPESAFGSLKILAQLESSVGLGAFPNFRFEPQSMSGLHRPVYRQACSGTFTLKDACDISVVLSIESIANMTPRKTYVRNVEIAQLGVLPEQG